MNDEIRKLIELESKNGTDFLKQSVSYPINDEAVNLGLTETDFLVIRLITSNGANLIQRHLYTVTEPSELEILLCEHLDKALIKLPLEKSTNIVYRWDPKPLVTLKDVNHVINYPAYLTASKDNLSTDRKYLYIIHLIANTNARSIYRVYEITPELPEFQVEFPRNTKFHIDKYEILKDGKVIIEMTELPEYTSCN